MSAYQSAQSDMTPKQMNFTSIYIPNLPEDLMLNGRNISNENDLAYLFEHQFPLGVVKRVDIATRPHRNGGHIRCAFVHFEEWNSPFSDNIRWQLANNSELRLYGPHDQARFYSAANRSFERFITLKVNKAPIAEVSELDAAEMNVHQLVDNYKRLEAKLAEKDDMIAELEQYIKHLQNVSDNRLQMIQDLEFDLVASRCAAGDVGNELDASSPRDYWMEEPADGGPMTLDELTLDETEDSSSGDEMQLVRLTPDNVSQYIGHEIIFRSRKRQVVTRIISVSSGLKTIKINHPDLQNNLEIVSRKVYVIV